MPDGARNIDPKSDPRRRCRKLAEWPEADRAAWHAAVAEGGLLEGGGPAAGWRATTRKAVQDATGSPISAEALRVMAPERTSPGFGVRAPG